ncbi:MAG: tRNA uridine-5-carboxymethylaminomethyl(34) synthesis GTPase MnmE [Acidobacteriota bacterium]
MISNEDTIVAISTPPGKGGIGIIRISGHDALKIASRVFVSKWPEKGVEPRKFYFGKAIDRDGRFLDHGYFVYFKYPASFTGEDTVEISCHGSPFIMRSILEEIAHGGARIAEPGEFTMRAFLNGRIDLVQAEAIRDLVEARTSFQARIAYEQIEGELSKRLAPLKEKLLHLIADAEASLDFPDADGNFMSRAEMMDGLNFISLEIKKLVDSYRDGRVIREGAIVAIVGSPNVGKSSIFNQLLKYDRAIVTDVPGTTRDTVEEMLDIGGIPVRLIDTAGLREGKDFIEREGVRRSKDAIKKSDFILYVIDCSRQMTKKEAHFFDELIPSRTLIVESKTDLPHLLKKNVIPGRFKYSVRISARTGEGVAELNKMIRKIISSTNEEATGEAIVTNVRQGELLRKTLSALEEANASMKKKVSEEFILTDLRKALDFFGEITGKVFSEEIYDRIFSKFCLGK